MQLNEFLNIFGGTAGLISVVGLLLKYGFERSVNKSLEHRNEAEADSRRREGESTLAQAIHQTLVQPLQAEVARMRLQLDNIDAKINEHSAWDAAVLRLLEDQQILTAEDFLVPPNPPPLR